MKSMEREDVGGKIVGELVPRNQVAPYDSICIRLESTAKEALDLLVLTEAPPARR